MSQELVAHFVFDLLVVVGAGFVAGLVCKRFGISMMVGYLLAGALLGAGRLWWGGQQTHELDYLAEVGVLLLLFTIGIEFSLDELRRMARSFLVGGSVQMALVALPVTLVTALLWEQPWPAAVFLGAAVAFSSTVLVFKSLEQWGQFASPHGRRAIAILLFQDAAVVPLVLIVPILTTGGAGPQWATAGFLALKSIALILAIPLGKRFVGSVVAPRLARARSVELLILFTLLMLGGTSLFAFGLGLPPMIGAFGAGLMLHGNRLTRQIDAVILPFRETFAAVFFVSLGTLIRFDALASMPWACGLGLIAIIALKTTAAAVALRVTGLPWGSALGTGLGMSQIGEFAFVLLMLGVSLGLLEPAAYQLMLFVGVVTLVVTPQLVRGGLRWVEGSKAVEHEMAVRPATAIDPIPRAVVVGAGLIGSRIASRLETMGYDTCLIDLSPINLHPFAQEGFRTAAGDATDRDVLERADIAHSGLVLVTIPDDSIAARVVEAVRSRNRACTLLVRCRYHETGHRLRKVGASGVFSEEVEIAGTILAWLDNLEKAEEEKAAASPRRGESRRAEKARPR